MKVKCKINKIPNTKDYIYNHDMSDIMKPGDIFVVYGMKFYPQITYVFIYIGNHLVLAPLSFFEIIEDKIIIDWKISIENNIISFYPDLFYENYFFDRMSDYDKDARVKFEELKIKYQNLI
jgi:hypothetical protein